MARDRANPLANGQVHGHHLERRGFVVEDREDRVGILRRERVRPFSTSYAISTTATLLTPILTPASVSASKCSTARSDSMAGAVTYQMRICVSARTRTGSASANEIVADAFAHLPAELTEIVVAERSP